MNNPFQDTIIAPATIPGTGAISIIRISGPEAFSVVDATVEIKGGKCASFNGFTIHYGVIYGNDGAFLDEVLVSIFRAPHSYTGEDSVEISCHASSYIVSEILSLLTTAGARMAKPGEFTERAFLNGKMDLTQAEAVADVISSNTSAFHRIASNQLRGGFSSELSELRTQLLEMASLLELELDFSEEVRLTDPSTDYFEAHTPDGWQKVTARENGSGILLNCTTADKVRYAWLPDADSPSAKGVSGRLVPCFEMAL